MTAAPAFFLPPTGEIRVWHGICFIVGATPKSTRKGLETMEWETEKLEGYLTITKVGEPGTVYRQRFSIPAAEAAGPDARRNILRCTGCDYPDIRCTKHSRTYGISSRIEPHERFCFRRLAFSGLEYRIALKDDYSASDITFWPVDGCVEHPEEFPDFLKKMTDNRHDGLTLSFCALPELLPKINRVAQLRHLTLMESYFGNNEEVFREIGRMAQLRGLCLHGAMCGVLETAAVGELCKLKNFETLCVHTAFPISVDAVRELEKLSNLRALHLELWGNCRIEQERRAALVSALSSLRSLEKLEFLVLNTSPRLSVRELALPPSLKYLAVNGHVCRLPGRPGKRVGQ